MNTERKLLFTIIKPYFLSLFGILLLMLTVVGLEALSPWPFKYLIDNVLGNEPLDTHLVIGKILAFFNDPETRGYVVVFSFFLISILLSFTEYLQSTSIKKVVKQIIYQFSKSAFANMETFDMGFFRRQEVGDYIYRLSYDVSALGDYVESGILPLITSALYLVITAAIMWTISVKLTLISLAALPFLAGGLYVFNKRIANVSKRSEFWNSAVFSFVQEALTQLKIIQAFSQEKYEATNFNKTVKTSLGTDVKLYRLNFLLSLLVGLIIAASYSIIIAIGIRYFFAGELSTGLLIVFIFYLDNLTNPLLNIIYATTDLREARVKIARMRDFFSNKTHSTDKGELTFIPEGSIEFKHVTLEGEQGVKILDDVSLKIKAGELVVLVGVSGSGKTSLISLIPRLINEPSSGQILIGGHDIKDYSIKALRDGISLVPQENILFNETIKEIIQYGKSDATFQELKHAAKLAMADEFISEHPSKYEYRVGEGGNYLSGGQRQRLMLARSFLKSAMIYILDEPLSMLDIKTRSQIWKTIQEVTKEKTVIIVTNVLDVITKADQVIFLSKGKIVEAGKHTDLLKKSSLYHLMVKTD